MPCSSATVFVFMTALIFAGCSDSEPGAGSGGGGAGAGTSGGGSPSGGASGSGGSAAGSGSGGLGAGGGSGGSAAGSGSGGSAAGGGSGGSGGSAAGGGSGGSAAGGGSGGSAAGGGSGGSSGGTAGGTGSGLPVPPGAGVPKPVGTPGNLRVLDWAGFKAAVSYTFDDSQPSHVAHYAELQATGVRMTFYVSNNNSDDATWTQAVNDGHEIGNHTAHHCRADLTGCSFGTAAASAAAEIEECNSYIVGHYPQTEVWTMAAPFGDGGWSSIAEQYFFLNRGVNGGSIAPNDSTSPFSLPVKGAVGGENVSVFNTDIDTAQGAGRWLIFMFHSILPTTATWYASVDIAAITGSISHAKQLGDVWVDSVVNVGAYWRAQKLLSSATPTISGSDQTWSWTLPAHFPSGKYLRVSVDGGTLSQAGRPLAWDEHGYYEVALDQGSLTLSP